METELEGDADGEAVGGPALVRFAGTLEVVRHEKKEVH